jgi:UDPglucose 6-dehydrogenase
LNCEDKLRIAKDDKMVVEKSTLPVRTAEAIKSILDNAQMGTVSDFSANFGRRNCVQNLLNGPNSGEDATEEILPLVDISP